jgi:sarcosine oxidase subunit beta
MAEHFDVLVVGGGVVGTSTAYHLAAMSDCKVALLERGQICSGGTARSCAIIRSHYSVPSNTELTVKSIEMFSDFADYLGTPEANSGFVRSGYLILGAEGEVSDKLVKNIRMQQKIGAKTFSVTHKEALEFHPLLDLSDIGAVGYEPCSGYADPCLTTNGFARAASLRGVKISADRRANQLLARGTRVIGAETDRGPIYADCVVLAIGPWTRDLTDSLGIETYLEISRHSVLTLQSDAVYEYDLPVIKDLSTENKMYFRPSTGGMVLVGTGDHGDRIEHPDKISEVVKDNFSLIQGRQISHRMRSFEKAKVTDSWVGPYDITPDWNPVLGAPDEWEGLILAYGFSGHGFKMAPAVGKMLAQTTLGQNTDIDITPYSLGRFNEGALLTGIYGIGSIS